MAEDPRTRIERILGRELDAACSNGVFPGASAAVAVWLGASWSYIERSAGVRFEGAERVGPDTVYDLASLTKPLVANAALRLHQAGVFDLAERVDVLVPEADRLPIGERTWEELLSHRSGLAAWAPFYETLPAAPGSEEARAWILAELLPRWERSQVGKAVYSDLGYILAGIGMTRATDQALSQIVEERVTAPLGIDTELFFGADRQDDGWKARSAPTGWSPWRRRILVSEVHDDNCAALGGVAGHAGMFGDAKSVARFGAACVGGWHGRRGAADEELVRHSTAVRAGGTLRLGWDGKAPEGSAAGTSIDADAFGHLGFTGTSIWCDPRRQIVIVLLSNRVAASDDNTAIRAFRPGFQDAVIAAFDGR